MPKDVSTSTLWLTLPPQHLPLDGFERPTATLRRSAIHERD
jgi:hypothetical protein